MSQHGGEYEGVGEYEGSTLDAEGPADAGGPAGSDVAFERDEVDVPPADERPEERSPVEDPRIAEALDRLERLADAPPDEHVEVYEDVHRVLQDTLSDAQRDGDQGGAQR